jgi:glycosyltransferase involved in cell wall biosynthesis
MPQISIITPIYNGVSYVENCIDNVIRQNCSEVEHIIIDGASTDGTVDILKQYAEEFPHIRWISEEDQGQSDALNKGIALANGDILGILNVDDYYQPNVLNRIVELFEMLPIPSLLVGNCNIWNSNRHLFHVNQPKTLGFLELLMGPSVYPFPSNPSAYFYHAKVHDVIGLYDIDDHFAMDLDFILRAVQTVNVKYVNETWGNFQMLEESKTQLSIQRGEHANVLDMVFAKHRETLAPYQQIITGTIYRLFKKPLFATPMYFYRNPNEFGWRVKARIQKVINPRKNARS